LCARPEKRVAQNQPDPNQTPAQGTAIPPLKAGPNGPFYVKYIFSCPQNQAGLLDRKNLHVLRSTTSA